MLYKNLNDEDSELWSEKDMEDYYESMKKQQCLSEDIENIDDFINNLINCGDFEMLLIA